MPSHTAKGGSDRPMTIRGCADRQRGKHAAGQYGHPTANAGKNAPLNSTAYSASLPRYEAGPRVSALPPLQLLLSSACTPSSAVQDGLFACARSCSSQAGSTKPHAQVGEQASRDPGGFRARIRIVDHGAHRPLAHQQQAAVNRLSAAQARMTRVMIRRTYNLVVGDALITRAW
jgi:hypothetical protein